MDYDPLVIHTPVASDSLLMTLLSLVVRYKLHMNQLDVKYAFLNYLPLSLKSRLGFRLFATYHGVILTPFSTYLFIESSRRPLPDMHYNTCVS